MLQKLIAKKIQCIVAPNEADAQLTHLINTGKAEAVVTEDSDLLAFGCSKCVYKIDRYGNGVEISLDQVLHDEASIFNNFDAETIRHICILSGCDYLPSIKGAGLKTVLKRFCTNKNTDQALIHFRYKLRKEFPPDYFEKFYLANLGFLHQWVYDIDEKNYVRLNPFPEDCSDDDIMLLGRIPTVQDSTIFRVNRIIPKLKPIDEPLKETISKEFIAYAETVKENIVPPRLLASPTPSSSTSSLSSPTKSKAKLIGTLPDKKHNTSIAISPANTTFADFIAMKEAKFSKSKKQEPNAISSQSQRLDALYKINGVLPRKASMAAIKPFSQNTEAEEMPSSSSTLAFSITHLKKSGIVSEFPIRYMKDRQNWICKYKAQRIPLSTIPESTKDRIRRIQKGKTTKRTIVPPLSSSSSTQASLSVSFVPITPSTSSQCISSSPPQCKSQQVVYNSTNYNTPATTSSIRTKNDPLSLLLSRKRSHDDSEPTPSDSLNRLTKHLKHFR